MSFAELVIYYSLYSFVLMLLYSIGFVTINHFSYVVCKVIDLRPEYMEQFAKILTSILCSHSIHWDQRTVDLRSHEPAAS